MSTHIAIYIITNIVNAKQYVGITKNLKRRWSDHKTGNKSSTLLKQSIKKHGVQNFVFTHIADAFDWEAAQIIERLLIAEKNTKSPHGYNMTEGGEGTLGFPSPNKGKPMSEEAKKKSSQSRIGKKSSDEARKNQSLALRGMKKSEEHKAKIGEAQRGIPCPQRGRKGKTLSEQAKKKLSDAKKGSVMSEETKQKIRASLLAKFALKKAASMELVK